jgi:hypothetical protein
VEKEPEHPPHHAGTHIHVLVAGFRLLVHLVANVVDQSGLVELRRFQTMDIHAWLPGPPSNKMQQLVSIRTQGQALHSAHALHIQKSVGPVDLPAVLIR